MAALHENYLDFFANAIRRNLSDMAGLSGEAGALEPQQTSFSSRGFAVILGITGAKAGRVIIDMDWQTAKELCDTINAEDVLDEEFVLDTLAEFTNIVAGHAVSDINNAFTNMGMMLTPPSVFRGENLKIVSPKLTAEVMAIKTSLGTIYISIGFEGGK